MRSIVRRTTLAGLATITREGLARIGSGRRRPRTGRPPRSRCEGHEDPHASGAQSRACRRHGDRRDCSLQGGCRHTTTSAIAATAVEGAGQRDDSLEEIVGERNQTLIDLDAVDARGRRDWSNAAIGRMHRQRAGSARLRTPGGMRRTLRGHQVLLIHERARHASRRQGRVAAVLATLRWAPTRVVARLIARCSAVKRRDRRGVRRDTGSIHCHPDARRPGPEAEEDDIEKCEGPHASGPQGRTCRGPRHRRGRRGDRARRRHGGYDDHWRHDGRRR